MRVLAVLATGLVIGLIVPFLLVGVGCYVFGGLLYEIGADAVVRAVRFGGLDDDR